METMAAFEAVEDALDPAAIHNHALKFSAAVFRDRLGSLIDEQLVRHGYQAASPVRKKVS